MPDENRKFEPAEIDPDKVEQLLQIELMQKRAQWQQDKARRSSLRTMSFLFLFFVMVAAALAFYIYFTGDRAGDLRSRAGAASPAPSPAVSPR